MKRIFNCIFLFFIMFSFSLIVNANSISRIEFDVLVDNDGNANVSESWQANLDRGTEGYHPYYNLGNSTFSNYTVRDDTGRLYTFDPNWNINNSFSQKAYKNGIYKDGDETDLCFGISEYGKRTYYLNYTINNFIYNTTDDYQILFWTFVPHEMNPKPDEVYIRIRSNFAYESTLDVWGYGNYGGTAYVYEGFIEATSPKNGLDDSEYMTILVKYPKGTFNTVNKINKTFDEVLSGAEENKTAYKDTGRIFEIVFTIIIYALFFMIPLIIAIIAERSAKSKLLQGKVYPKKDVLPFRDLPFKENYFFANFIGLEYKLISKNTNLLGAMLLKWIKEDKVSVTTEEKGVFKTKSTKILLNVEPSDDYELRLFNMMKEAASDNILEENEFKKWCKEHYSRILGWFDEVNNNEYNKAKQDPTLITKEEKKKMFGTQVQFSATPKLNEDAAHLAGLKAFFKDFTSLNEKEPIEVKMWREYLIYAQILGMADKVAKDFKKLYPDVITDMTYDNIVIINNFSSTTVKAATAAKSYAEAQERARSYSSGGGGFSSGGGGGGSFGGGGGGGGFR